MNQAPMAVETEAEFDSVAEDAMKQSVRLYISYYGIKWTLRQCKTQIKQWVDRGQLESAEGWRFMQAYAEQLQEEAERTGGFPKPSMSGMRSPRGPNKNPRKPASS